MIRQVHISVILPVYNGGEFLAKAIQSVLNQTYPHFEFIIINDGSTDDSDTIIKSFADERIVYVRQENKGLGATLNEGLLKAKGEFIARQDQDDISYPQRFERQIGFLNKHPEILLTGTWARILKNLQEEMGYHKHSCSSALLHFDMLFDNPFVHSSVMFRKEAITKAGNYSNARDVYEDFDLWSRFLNYGKLANIPEVLLDYCHHLQGMSKSFHNFKEDALSSQGYNNMKILTGRDGKAYSDLTAVYHFKQNLYKGSALNDLHKAIDEIKDALLKLYPDEATALLKRAVSYKKVIKFRLNVLKINNPNTGKLIKFISKLDNKLHPDHEFINRSDENNLPL